MGEYFNSMFLHKAAWQQLNYFNHLVNYVHKDDGECTVPLASFLRGAFGLCLFSHTYPAQSIEPSRKCSSQLATLVISRRYVIPGDVLLMPCIVHCLNSWTEGKQLLPNLSRYSKTMWFFHLPLFVSGTHLSTDVFKYHIRSCLCINVLTMPAGGS